MHDPLPIDPFDGPIDTTVVVPGSKSYTNRALVCAALASGRSTVSGALLSDDTEAMLGCLRSLGPAVEVDGTTFVVNGSGGAFPNRTASLDCRQSGTTARFVLPMVSLGQGSYVVDAHAQMRSRPMHDQIGALRSLGAMIVEQGPAGHLPVSVRAEGLTGGAVSLPGTASSQFLSGLLLSGPLMADGLDVRITTALVSRSYVDLTVEVMRAFGAQVEEPDGRDANRFVVAPGEYRATSYAVEPDASAASYFFALAAITGGKVTVPGLGAHSKQGDTALVSILARMGCNAVVTDDAISVSGFAREGVEVDMSDCSDVASTLAVVAAFADSPTRVTGIGFIRKKETDRIAAVVTELRRCGIDAEEEADGFFVRPSQVRSAVVQTYQDHRMAMSFALLGARSAGIAIADPTCVNKTFPEFWKVLDSCRANYGGGS
jgi:3-phosphoshikimate 1-carboxyvinyltransferase